MKCHDAANHALALVTNSAKFWPSQISAALIDKTIARARQWSLDRRIQGFGSGYRTESGHVTTERCLRVYVDDSEDHGAALRVPPFIEIPWLRTQVPLEVRRIGRVHLTSTLDAVFRPALPGCAISTPGKSRGSFGCLVRDLPPLPGTYILSGAHVIANSTFDPEGLPVLQPGGLMGVDQLIGSVTRWGTLEFTPNTFPNLFEAAIARVDPRDVRPDIIQIGRPTGVSPDVVETTTVKKCGAATAVTHGTVADANFHCVFHFIDPNGNAQRAGFQQQILCTSGSSTPFSDGGDSGAAVLDHDN